MALFGRKTPARHEVAGLQLRCEICKHDEFWHRRAQLHTAVASFFDLEWVQPSAECFVCAHCGYIHWFLPQ
jgi:hypothetical protein